MFANGFGYAIGPSQNEAVQAVRAADAGPVAAAVLALGAHIGATGRDLIDALVIGIEVSCRIEGG